MDLNLLIAILLPIPPALLTLEYVRQRGNFRIVDLGVVFSWIAFLYAWLPLVGFLLQFAGIGKIADEREVQQTFSSDAVTTVGLSYLVFIIGFCFSYGTFRKPVINVTEFLQLPYRPAQYVMWGAIFLVASMSLIDLVFGVGNSSSYIDSYTALRSFPLIVQQTLGILKQLEFSFFLGAMVFLISRKPNTHIYFLTIIVFIVGNSIVAGSGRSFGVLSGLAYLICFSVFVRRLSIGVWSCIAISGVLGFLVMGFLRGDTPDRVTGLLSIFQNGEFSSVFINSLDLLAKSGDVAIQNISSTFYFTDLLRPIPQQLIPIISKFDPASWYVNTFYPEFANAGGGLVFGTIAESVVGFGIFEALIRGLFLGVFYAWITNKCLSRKLTATAVFVYIWFVIMSYQAVRDTTFILWTRCLYQLLPVILFSRIAKYKIVFARKGG